MSTGHFIERFYEAESRDDACFNYAEAMERSDPLRKINEIEESSSIKQPVFSCDATAASTPGEYDITVSGAEAQNYEISYVSGVLTVEQVSGIERIFVDGKRVDVYSISGVLYKKDVVSPKELPQGIYIINGKKYVVK